MSARGNPVLVFFFLPIIDTIPPFRDTPRMARITLADDWKDFRGRIGDAVIYSWRGIICMRGYVVPRNPDTPAQRERRQRFAAAVLCWKSLPHLMRPRRPPRDFSRGLRQEGIVNRNGSMDPRLHRQTRT